MRLGERLSQDTGIGEMEREKQTVALSSVLAAVFLTTMKLGVGIWTGSLGILAEAAHSGLDLVAALVTFLAVRVSDRPPDKEHPYGHGKVENLSALVETLLLLITCIWIIYEAIGRLFFKKVEIEANAWAFAVMVISIGIDFARSRALRRAAEKHDSQALEADALHFSTDIWSSCVVIAGLAIIKINEWIGGPSFLVKADAISALGVAFIVIYVSLELGKRTVAVLLDTAPEGLAEEIKTRVEQIEGVTTCRQVRIRRAGAKSFVDITLEIEGDASFEKAHRITASAEEAVHQLIPRVDVLVHYEPGKLSRAISPGIKTIAQSIGATAHSIWAHEDGGRYHVELHLEVDPQATLEEAHDMANHLEAQVKEAMPMVTEVVTHIEPMGDTVSLSTPMDLMDQAELEKKVVALANALCGEGTCHDVEVREEGDGLVVSLHCFLSPEMPIQQAHILSEQLEGHLREEIPELRRAVIHVEPPD
jgi:cation diffusion facilitator family transporter